MMRGMLLLCVSIFALTACTVGKDYVSPPIDVDSKWVAPDDELSTPIDDAQPMPTNEELIPVSWWTQFGDATLDTLIAKALKNNNDLKVAVFRIAEARANERLNNSVFFPQIDATARGTRGTIGGALDNTIENSQRYGVNGSWEIDVFGGNRRRSEAAEAGVEAAIADKEVTKLQLIEEVARNYTLLRGLQEQRALTLRNVALQQRTLQITQAQYDERVVTRLDVLRASAQLKNTRTRLPQIDAQAYAAINRLTVLLGEKVREIKPLLQTSGNIPSVPELTVSRSPIATLKRRPDIQAAERRLAQASALSAAAFAGYFPRLTLEGFFGAADSSVFGSSSPWSATINSLFPLLNFGRIESQVDIAEAQENQALFGFKQTVLVAVEEVENAFFGYLREVERQDMFTEIAQEQGKAAQVAREQYLNGIAPQLDLLNAEQSALSAETNAVISRTDAAINLIRLYTALGYGSGKIDSHSIESDTENDQFEPKTRQEPVQPEVQEEEIEPEIQEEQRVTGDSQSNSELEDDGHSNYPRILPDGVDPNIYP